MITDEMRYRLIRLLEANPQMSQRAAARELGMSVGKINYCLRALVRTGMIKARRFTNSSNKAAYMYLLTPRGIEAKAGLTVKFLQAKTSEYEKLRQELDEIRREALRLTSR